MSKIEDLLNKTVRIDNEIKRGVVVSGIAIGLCLTIGCFFCILYLADVGGYLQDNKQIIHLYDFYDQKVGENETAIFFFGSSVVGYDIYPPAINSIIKKKYPNITVYDLAVDGDLPIERALEIQKIINAKPSLVILGITSRSVTVDTNDAQFFERTKPVYSRLDIRDDSLWLYTEDEKMYFTPMSDLEKIKYLRSAIKYKITGQTPYGAMNYSIDPYGGEKLRARVSLLKNGNAIIADANDPNNGWHRVVTNESTRNGDALIYIVKTLQDEGIPVIILNMPIHPLHSEKITDESRANFYELLNKLGVLWYDLERDYGDEFFRDSIHANFEGSLKFAPRMADLIIEQVEKDVIHYT